jgi:hypothetical protein
MGLQGYKHDEVLARQGTTQGQRNLGNLIIVSLIPLYESLTPIRKH